MKSAWFNVVLLSPLKQLSLPPLSLPPPFFLPLLPPCPGFKARVLLDELRAFKAAQYIQKHVRQWQHRQRFLAMKEAQILVASQWRMYAARKAYIATREKLAATRIQVKRRLRGLHRWEGMGVSGKGRDPLPERMR